MHVGRGGAGGGVRGEPRRNCAVVRRRSRGVATFFGEVSLEPAAALDLKGDDGASTVEVVFGILLGWAGSGWAGRWVLKARAVRSLSYPWCLGWPPFQYFRGGTPRGRPSTTV